MKIGIVSDTHGHVARTKAAASLLAQANVEAVLHCGDIGSAEVIRQLYDWPGHFVVGNVDQGIENELADAMSQQQTWHGEFADFVLHERRIAIAHGHDRKRLESCLASDVYDLVCCGHTHQAQQRRVGNTLLLNPGALYRSAAPSCAVVDLATLEVQMLLLPGTSPQR